MIKDSHYKYLIVPCLCHTSSILKDPKFYCYPNRDKESPEGLSSWEPAARTTPTPLFNRPFDRVFLQTSTVSVHYKEGKPRYYVHLKGSEKSLQHNK